MPTDIVIPEMGESVTSGVVAAWLKKAGDVVRRDDPVLELETDKITSEILAPAAGRLVPMVEEGSEVKIGAVVGRIEEAADVPATPPARGAPNGSAPKPAAPPQPVAAGAATAPREARSDGPGGAAVRATPLARKAANEHGVDLTGVKPTGAGGRITEHDVLGAAKAAPAAASPAPAKPAPVPPAGPRGVRREKMSPLRQRVAQRLVEAQHTAAMLTTFNECDMTAVMRLRKQHAEAFEKRHGVKLGFMSFFVRAAANALGAFPAVNASIVNPEAGAPEIEYHDYADIAVAVGTPRGLVVPVLRDCQSLSFGDIESRIKDLAARAQSGKLAMEDLTGGTFTITNGGIYGSLMSTPILNPPQTGILGMHAIKNRPVEDPDKPGQLALRPMMYLALSYDHRVVDGQGAVQFLVAIKNAIEQPERLLLEL